MVAKVFLAALISIGLAIVGVATVHVVLAESTANAAANGAVREGCSAGGGSAACEGADRRGHLAWNAASWLIGIALVVAAGRRAGAQLAAD